MGPFFDFKSAVAILGSRIKALEVLSIIEGVKPAARLLCAEDKIEKTCVFLEKLGLSLAISDFKVVKDRSQGLYVDLSVRVEKSDPRKGHLILYVAKAKNEANEAKAQELSENHQILGEILGYPPCCVDFFAKKFSSSHTDLTLDTFRDSKGNGFPKEMNICARHLDVSLLSHFPCSFDCRKSMEIACKNIKLLREHDEKEAQEWRKILSMPILYTKDRGIFFFGEITWKGKELSFDELICTSVTKLNYLLGEEKKILIKGKKSVSIGSHDISGNDIGMMIFS